MGFVTIRDNSLWTKHIEGDAEIVTRILGLPANAPIRLVIDGSELSFRKMRDGTDGRPTAGLRPDQDSRAAWDKLLERRGIKVRLHLPDHPVLIDPYLASLVPLLDEWTSTEDARAYDGL